uniref:Uncharacterized protein n=1 Tax=Anguilla anguilla TaxID=7936 RepID=A0A0E9X584_ANGAN
MLGLVTSFMSSSPHTDNAKGQRECLEEAGHDSQRVLPPELHFVIPSQTSELEKNVALSDLFCLRHTGHPCF